MRNKVNYLLSLKDLVMQEWHRRNRDFLEVVKPFLLKCTIGPKGDVGACDD